MKTTIKLISGAAILLASLSGQAIAQETIKVGMSGKYFPFTFVKQDKLQGFEVDMWNQIGERTGYKVEFVTASFSGLFGMLETGRVDTISNQITITDERKAKYAFSQPYVYDGAQIVVRKGQQHHPRHQGSGRQESRRQPGLQLRRAAAQERPQQEDRYPHL